MSSDVSEDGFDPSPLPTKRRRLHHKIIEDSDEDSSVAEPSPDLRPRQRQRKTRSARTSESPDLLPKTKKPPKPKHFVHVHTNPVDFEDRFVTQAPPPDASSSPWRLRGAIWKKPPREPPPAVPDSAKENNEDIDFKRLQQELKSVNDGVKSGVAPVRSLDTGASNPASHTFPLTESVYRQNGKPVVPGPAMAQKSQATTSQLDFDIEQELADLPSDAFASTSSSPERPSTVNSKEIIQISSQIDLSPAPLPNLVAPRNGLQQMTLFGAAAQSVVTSSQANKKHNWPLARRDELPTHHKLDDEALKTYVYPTNLGNVRDYQFSIVKRGLFHNLLVALPTGLGKTFIAATIMLNWFRWTKDAQIVFVAPTKPLVSQQVEACFGIAGIPKSQTTMLTGGISPGLRAEAWTTKRVFFMTPQTLINDLKTGIADPKRVVLLVVDEAHRATGAYAYVEVVNFLRRFNTSFRVLALTATPGATVESVQEVIDGLKISRIEIRTEFSIDIRQYVHSKQTETFTFEDSEEMKLVMDLFSKALHPLLQKLNSQNGYWTADPMQMHAYGLNQARQKWMVSAGRNANAGIKGMVNRLFSVLASQAHSIELLKYHGIGPFYHNMVSFRNSVDGMKAAKYEKEIIESEPFQKMMSTVGFWIRNDTFVGHPKLEYLQEVVLNHFLDAGDGRAVVADQPPSATRIMIFAHYRDSAEEIVRVLKRNEPMVRPHVFVGQAASKGSEGMDQKRQLEVIHDFKTGKFNTLVATSIGEEGLDIGEIDLIICYDSSSSPIRMLQRMGRTGRKRAGKIILLLMKGKEANSFVSAKDNYEKMQSMIANGNKFTFHEDTARRIVPKHIDPVVDKRVVEIPVENTQGDLPEPKKRGRAPKRPAKKFHMPDGVHTGFVTASRMEGDVSGDDRPAPLKRRRVAASEPAIALESIVPLDQVLLSKEQDEELFRKYQNLPAFDDAEYVVQPPSLTEYPDRQCILAPTFRIKHGKATLGAVNVLDTMRKVNMSRISALARYSRRLDMDKLCDNPRVVESEMPLLKPKAAPKPRRPRASKAKVIDAHQTGDQIMPRAPAARGNAGKAPDKPLARRSANAGVYRRDGDAIEADISSPPPTPSGMALQSQGIDLGADTTSGEDEDEGEPSSQMRDFIVEEDDIELEPVLSSSPEVPRPGRRATISTAGRLGRRMPSAVADLSEDDSDEELPSLDEIFRGRGRGRMNTGVEELATKQGNGNKRTKRVVDGTSESD